MPTELWKAVIPHERNMAASASDSGSAKASGRKSSLSGPSMSMTSDCSTSPMTRLEYLRPASALVTAANENKGEARAAVADPSACRQRRRSSEKNRFEDISLPRYYCLGRESIVLIRELEE